MRYFLRINNKIIGKEKLSFASAKFAAEQLSKKLGGVPVEVNTFRRGGQSTIITHTSGTPFRYRPSNPHYKARRPFSFAIDGRHVPHAFARTFEEAKAKAPRVLLDVGGRSIDIIENGPWGRISRKTFNLDKLLK